MQTVRQDKTNERRVTETEKKAVYDTGLPGRMYAYFTGYEEADGAPSFPKFARKVGVTPEDLEKFRTHKAFDKSYRACRDIRRDYLIDKALSKRFDASLVKFLLTTEFGMGEETPEDKTLAVTLEILP